MDGVDLVIGDLRLAAGPGHEGVLADQVGIGVIEEVPPAVQEPDIAALPRACIPQERSQEPGQVDLGPKVNAGAAGQGGGQEQAPAGGKVLRLRAPDDAGGERGGRPRAGRRLVPGVDFRQAEVLDTSLQAPGQAGLEQALIGLPRGQGRVQVAGQGQEVPFQIA